MADVARTADTVVRIGFTFRRAPGVAALRELVTSGTLGRVLHVDVRYWCDYASDPQGPISWRYKGAPGSGALADIGSHAAYLAEFLCGDIGGGERRAICHRDHEAPGAAGRGDRPWTRGRERHVRARRERRLRRLQRPVRQWRRCRPGLPGRSRPPEWPGHRGLRRQRRREVGPGAAGRVPADAERGPHRNPGIPPGDHRPGPPVRGRRSADGRTRSRPRPERRVLLPGASVPGGGRRDRRGGLATPLRRSFDEGVHNMEVLAAVTESVAKAEHLSR